MTLCKFIGKRITVIQWAGVFQEYIARMCNVYLPGHAPLSSSPSPQTLCRVRSPVPQLTVK